MNSLKMNKTPVYGKQSSPSIKRQKVGKVRWGKKNAA
jgi:hypothetical protein